MKIFLQQLGKKKVILYGSITCITILLISVGIWYTLEQTHKRQVLDSINITFKENLFIEYGQKDIDYESYIQERIGDPEIVLPTKEINTKELGIKEVTYELKKDGYSKQIIFEIEIKDTKAPVITFKQDTVTLDINGTFDKNDNIESISDPVDGAIPYLNAQEIETMTSELAEGDTLKGYYTLTGDVDTSAAGSYTITIKAIDNNGNEATKEFTVTVQEKVIEQSQTQPYNNTNNGNGYTAPNVGSSNSGNNTTCNANGQWKSTGNSGVAFYSWGEADNYGSTHVPDGYYYGCITVTDICGKTGWSPSFKPY